jgi:anti-anti-sigma factor
MEPKQGSALRLHGELDDEACAAVRRRLAPLLARELRHLVIDLSGVHTLSSAGVQLLQGLEQHLRRQGGALILIHPTPAVERSLHVHELGDLLEIRDLLHAEPPRTVVVLDDADEDAAASLAGVVPLTRRHGRFRPADGGKGQGLTGR